MKIALVITELHPGGAEKCFVQLALFLKRQGHDVAIWQLWPEPPEDRRQLTSLLDAKQIPWFSGNCRHAWQFPSACRWLRRQLLAFSPDVVQAFLFHANIAAAHALRGTTTPLFGGARVRQPERWRQWAQRLAARRMHQLICVSQSVAEHCHRFEGISPERLVVIANGVSQVSDGDWTPSNLSAEIQQDRCDAASQRDWQQFGLPPKAQVLLQVGRLSKQKGVLPLVEHARLFLEALQEHHLVFMGDGGQREQLEIAIAGSKFSRQIHCVGWQPDARQWMAKAECLVLAAEYEGMPNAVLEAMAAGRPVVCFEVDGVRELLGEGALAEAQLAAAGAFHQLADKLIALSADAELRMACGAANRERANTFFCLEKQLEKYERLYAAALGDQQTRR